MSSSSRYRNLNTLENKKFLETSNFPTRNQLNSIPTIQIVTTQFDRLDNLAFKYLGNTEYWWIISEYNGIDYFFAIPEGTTLQIPTDLNAVLALY
jgi:hypothetical protein